MSLKPFVDNPKLMKQKVAISQYPRSEDKDGQVMGYSIRNERYRLILWRERSESKIVATELYDEKNDPAETVNLSNKPESNAIIESLSTNVPTVVTQAPRNPTR